jgi:hypothetical protein
MAARPPVMTILSDGPLLGEQWTDDSFFLEQRLGAVFDILRHANTTTPMAAALYGDWGTGKTSAMRWLDGALQHWNGKRGGGPHKRVHTVWFYPWKYHTQEDVWRGLIAEVIIKTLDLGEVTVPRLTKAAKEFGLFLGRSFLNVLRGIKVKVGTEGAGAELDLESIERVVEDYRATAHPEAGYLNEFEDSLTRWVRESLGKDDRLVLFIDDLDRCLPDVALQVLEALKLYLRIEDLIFLVGVDRQVIQELVRGHYEKLKVSAEKSREYLAKMFQVEINVTPGPQQMAGYLDECLDELNRRTKGDDGNGIWQDELTDEHRRILTDVLSKLARGNPREVKRLLNSAVQTGYGQMQSAETEDDRELAFAQGVQSEFVARILDRWPSYYGGSRRLLSPQSNAQQFFEQWSEVAVANPNAKPPRLPERTEEVERLQKQRRELPDPERRTRLPAPKMEEADLDGVAEVYRSPLETWSKWPEFIWIRRWLARDELWQLMKIPYSAEAAAAASAGRAEKVEGEGLAMPDAIRLAVASQAGKPPEEVTKADLAQVSELNLEGTQVTDAGLAHLAGLTALERLWLIGTQVTDAGLAHLSRLTALEVLWLDDTQVTDAGVRKLKEALPECHIYH